MPSIVFGHLDPQHYMTGLLIPVPPKGARLPMKDC